MDMHLKLLEFKIFLVFMPYEQMKHNKKTCKWLMEGLFSVMFEMTLGRIWFWKYVIVVIASTQKQHG